MIPGDKSKYGEMAKDNKNMYKRFNNEFNQMCAPSLLYFLKMEKGFCTTSGAQFYDGLYSENVK